MGAIKVRRSYEKEITPGVLIAKAEDFRSALLWYIPIYPSFITHDSVNVPSFVGEEMKMLISISCDDQTRLICNCRSFLGFCNTTE